MTSKVFVDLDGVIFDFDGKAAKHFGGVKNETAYSLKKRYGITDKEEKSYLVSHDSYVDLDVIDGAGKAAAELHRRDDTELIFLTARPATNDIVTETILSIGRATGIDKKEFAVIFSGSKKVAHITNRMTHLGKTYLIDDSPFVMDDIPRSSGIIGVIVDASYNKGAKCSRRVTSLKEFECALKTKNY